MPNYVYACYCGSVQEAFRKVDQRDDSPVCCGRRMAREIQVPMLIIPPEVHYTSPVDDRPITSMQARREDLARNGCVEYDPEMKTDVDRLRKSQDEALDKAVDETIDRELAAMPARKLEKLASELINEGLTVEPVRLTA